MMASMKTAAERKRDERKRMRKAGYVLRQFWVHPKDWVRVAKYLRRIKNGRSRSPAARRAT
jgi:hypothetical protein